MENNKKVKYLPYTNAEEFLKSQKEHGPGIIILGTISVPTRIKESKNKNTRNMGKLFCTTR